MQEINYRTVNSRDGFAYAKMHQGKLQAFNKLYEIHSHAGTVYSLANGEVVLVNLTDSEFYPGFVFKNYDAFKECVDEDYFPIPKEYMTWLEAHKDEMQNFLKDDSFYLDPLKRSLNIKVPFESLSDCEKEYFNLRNFIKSKSKSRKEKDAIFHCYGLCVAKFLIEKKGFKWKLVKKYEIYNPYYYPVLSGNERTNINVFNKLDISFGDKSKEAFSLFCWSVTNSPYNLQNGDN